jgi:hypothetical protein
MIERLDQPDAYSAIIAMSLAAWLVVIALSLIVWGSL